MRVYQLVNIFTLLALLAACVPAQTATDPENGPKLLKQVVRKGETLYRNALYLGTTPEVLMQENHLKSPTVVPGQVLWHRYDKPLRRYQAGEASWYGPKFAGKRTASGEVFDPERLTAAHPRLPFGTRVLVIRNDTGEAVWVRINDRGPFKKGRIIDLSAAAARAIDLDKSGVAKVTLYLP